MLRGTENLCPYCESNPDISAVQLASSPARTESTCEASLRVSTNNQVGDSAMFCVSEHFKETYVSSVGEMESADV
jgi:hypothetical protein